MSSFALLLVESFVIVHVELLCKPIAVSRQCLKINVHNVFVLEYHQQVFRSLISWEVSRCTICMLLNISDLYQSKK